MIWLLFVLAFLVVALAMQIAFFAIMQTDLVYNVVLVLVETSCLALCGYVLYRRLRERAAVARLQSSASVYATYPSSSSSSS